MIINKTAAQKTTIKKTEPLVTFTRGAFTGQAKFVSISKVKNYDLCSAVSSNLNTFASALQRKSRFDETAEYWTLIPSGMMSDDRDDNRLIVNILTF